MALLRCTTGWKENTRSRVQPLLGACLSRKGREPAQSLLFTKEASFLLPSTSESRSVLVWKAGVPVGCDQQPPRLDLICRNLMFNQDGWFFLVGAKGPYRCVYGPAGRFKATVTGREEDGTRFMDGG